MAEPNGTARLGVIFSAIGAGAVVIGMAAGLAVVYSQLVVTAQVTQDQKERIDHISSQLSDTRAEITSVCADLKEVETQFKAADQVRNVMHANDLRVLAMLWRKSFGSDYPVSNSYYPTIAQEQPAPCK